MEVILNDFSKFHKIGPVSSCDNTNKIEVRVQRHLLSVYKCKLLSKMVYNHIRPVRSQCPCIYGLPKVHKESVLLRAILSMVVSVQNISQMVSWITSASFLSVFYVLYIWLIWLSNFIRNSDLCSGNKLMVTFDIVSLYTNVPLQDTLQICTDVLYSGHLGAPIISENLF